MESSSCSFLCFIVPHICIQGGPTSGHVLYTGGKWDFIWIACDEQIFFSRYNLYTWLSNTLFSKGYRFVSHHDCQMVLSRCAFYVNCRLCLLLSVRHPLWSFLSIVRFKCLFFAKKVFVCSFVANFSKNFAYCTSSAASPETIYFSLWFTFSGNNHFDDGLLFVSNLVFEGNSMNFIDFCVWFIWTYVSKSKTSSSFDSL